MGIKFEKVAFFCILALTLFSYWAGFALLIINPNFHQDVPGYTIGRICIWEVFAIGAALLISYLMIREWGGIEVRKMDGGNRLVLHPYYGYYFIFYFFVATLTGIWQFWLFSQQF